MKKNSFLWVVIAMGIFVVAGSALVIAPKFAIDNTKAKAIENINETYNDEFLITHSNISKRPFKDSFVGIVQSQITGASFNATFVDGVGEIPDYEHENYLMTFNTIAEETFENSLAISHDVNDKLTMRLFTTNAIDEAKQQQFIDAVKAQHPDATMDVEVLVVSAEAFEQLSMEIPVNYQRSIIAQEANFDNFNPEVSTFNF